MPTLSVKMICAGLTIKTNLERKGKKENREEIKNPTNKKNPIDSSIPIHQLVFLPVWFAFIL